MSTITQIAILSAMFIGAGGFIVVIGMLASDD